MRSYLNIILPLFRSSSNFKQARWYLCCVLLNMVLPQTTFGQVFTIADHQQIGLAQGNFEGQLREDGFGSAIAQLGDLDGDGIIDIAVGANNDDDGGEDRGAIWILFLNADGTVKSHQKISNTQGGFSDTLGDFDRFGLSIAHLNDLDGDGITDIAVGAPNNDSGGFNKGAIWILFLNQDGTVKSHQKISESSGNFTATLGASNYFGASLAPVGDLNNDGIIDLAVGAVGDADGGIDHGAVWILFLNQNGTVKNQQKISDTQGNFTGVLNTRTIFSSSGTSVAGDLFGSNLAPLGDLDGDGIPDLAVSAIQDSENNINNGAVWILLLNSNGTVKAHQKIHNTKGNFVGQLDDFDFFGKGLAFLNDLDDDGYKELAVGAQGDDDDETNSGAVWILSLNTDGTVKSYKKIGASIEDARNALSNDLFGLAIAGFDHKDTRGIVKIAVGSAGNSGGSVWILSLQTPRPSLSLSTDSIDFGPTQIDVAQTKQLVISNVGDKSLSISNIITSNPQFTVSSTSLNISPLLQDTLTVTFTPHPDSLRNLNGIQATLSFQTNDGEKPFIAIPLSGSMPRQDPLINISISSINFGRVVQTGSKGTSIFDITNTGNNDLVVSSITISNDAYTIAPNQATIPWNTSQTFEFTFQPVIEGDYNATLTITSNDPDNATIEIPIRAFAPEGTNPKLELSVQSHDFGAVSTGTTDTAQIQVTNTGKERLEIRDITPPADFSTEHDQLDIAPGDSLFLNIHFSPTQRITYADSLTFTTNDPQNRNVVIYLNGQGQRPTTPALSLSTQTIHFGNLLTGSIRDTSLTLLNDGQQPLQISEITVSDTAFLVTPAQIEIPPGEQTTLNIQFKPRQVKTYTDSLTFITNDPNRQHISILLQAQTEAPPKPQVAVFPEALYLGEVFFLNTTDTVLVISNTGQVTLNITNISANHSRLSFSNDILTIAPETSVQLPITLRPTDPDTFQAIITLETNDPDRAQIQIPIHARFTNWPAPPIPGPILLDLDTQSNNQNTIHQEIPPDQSFTVQLYANDIPEVNGYRLKVAFDPLMLEFVGFSAGDIMGGGVPITNKNEGIVDISVALFGSTHKGGSGFLAELDFRTTTELADSTYIAVTQVSWGKVDGNGAEEIAMNVVATIQAGPPVNRVIGDFDNDGTVGFTDFLQFAAAFGKADADLRFDLDGSGSVGFQDFLIFANAFGSL